MKRFISQVILVGLGLSAMLSAQVRPQGVSVSPAYAETLVLHKVQPPYPLKLAGSMFREAF